jgi:hypothetical protein
MTGTNLAPLLLVCNLSHFQGNLLVPVGTIIASSDAMAIPQFFVPLLASSSSG